MFKKFTSIILSVIMILSCVSFTVFAADDSVTVTISVSDSGIILPPTTLEVEPGTAKAYGYAMSATDHNGIAVNGVTVLDAVVAAHKELYGDAFTAETASDYLAVYGGFIIKSFGISASYSSFLVNGVVPNDGIINPAYGTPTGYTCDTAVISDGDFITYYFYRFNSRYDDMYAEFDSENYETTVGEELNVNISGYCPMYYGYDSAEVIAANTSALVNVDIYTFENGTLKKIGTTDANGNASLTFDSEGEYVLVASRSTEGEAAVIYTYSNVTVGAAESNDCFIVRIFKAICSFFENIIQFILNGVC